jgi:membrane protein
MPDSNAPVQRSGTTLFKLALVTLYAAGVFRALTGKVPVEAGVKAPDVPPSEAAKLPGRGWWQIAKATWAEAGKDRVMAVAAGVTFYALLALFPAITAFVSIYGLFADRTTIVEHLSLLNSFMPEAAITLIRAQIESLISNDNSTLTLATTLGLLVALWSANGGTKAMIEALNVAYGSTEKRGFVKLNALSLAMTFGMLIAVLLLLAAAAVLPLILALLPTSRWLDTLLLALRWPLIVALILGVLAVLYRYGPDRGPVPLKWITPGAIFASVGIALTSVLFAVYAGNFASYDKTYGALGAVIALMTWLWLSATVVLIGAELNNVVEEAA